MWMPASGDSIEPPQTTMSPGLLATGGDQTATWRVVPSAPDPVIACHRSRTGSYAPPSAYTCVVPPSIVSPPHTIMSEPVHTAVCDIRAAGAPTVVVARHVSVIGS